MSPGNEDSSWLSPFPGRSARAAHSLQSACCETHKLPWVKESGSAAITFQTLSTRQRAGRCHPQPPPGSEARLPPEPPGSPRPPAPGLSQAAARPCACPLISRAALCLRAFSGPVKPVDPSRVSLPDPRQVLRNHSVFYSEYCYTLTLSCFFNQLLILILALVPHSFHRTRHLRSSLTGEVGLKPDLGGTNNVLLDTPQKLGQDPPPEVPRH